MLQFYVDCKSVIWRHLLLLHSRPLSILVWQEHGNGVHWFFAHILLL